MGNKLTIREELSEIATIRKSLIVQMMRLSFDDVSAGTTKKKVLYAPDIQKY